MNLYEIVYADIASKTVSLCFCAYFCKEIVFSKNCAFKEVIHEVKENITIGSKLLIANISGILINGIVRIGIQTRWDVATYGKISLSITLTNVFLTVVSAISLVLYPLLKQTPQHKIAEIYHKSWSLVFIAIVFCFIFYYPMMLLLSKWIPQYKDSLVMLGILLPICIFSIKQSLLINTILKVLREEKAIMIINLFSIFVALVSTFLSIYLWGNLTLAVFCILVNTIIKCVLSDIYLSKRLDVKFGYQIINELLATSVFIVSSWLIGGKTGMLLFGTYILLLLFVYRKEIVSSIDFFKPFLIKSEKEV